MILSGITASSVQVLGLVVLVLVSDRTVLREAYRTREQVRATHYNATV
jgi:hypothetical protein